MTARSFLDYAADPVVTAPPWPGPDRLDPRDGAFYLGDLDAAALAVDLAALGLTWSTASGFVLDGRRADDDEAADALASILDEAADLLPVDPVLALSHRLDDARRAETRARAHVLAVLASPSSTDREVFVARHTLATRSRALRTAEATHAAHAARRRRSLAWVPDALRATATRVRTSRRAAAVLLARVRRFLPAPSTSPTAEEAATAFLDDLATASPPRIRRAALWPAYLAAGEPGGLSRGDLLAFASSLWGPPRKTDGHYVYRPRRNAAAA